MPGSCPLGALSLVNTVAGYLKSWVWKPNVLSGTSCRELYFSDVFPHPSLTVALNYLYKTRRPQRRTNTGQTPRWVTASLPHCLHSDFSKEMPEMSQGREDVWECVHASNRENLWRKVLWLPCYWTVRLSWLWTHYVANDGFEICVSFLHLPKPGAQGGLHHALLRTFAYKDRPRFYAGCHLHSLELPI